MSQNCSSCSSRNDSTQNESSDSYNGFHPAKLPSIDDFIFLKPISRGAFGKVFLGRKQKGRDDRLYAIKVMKKSEMINKNLVNQVKAERDAMAALQSPFIVKLFYSLQSHQNVFLVMEYMIGGDVKSLLSIYGYFDEDMAIMYTAEVTLALEYLHGKGIVHRDLKPDNMLIAANGHLKLTDFGLSKLEFDADTFAVGCGRNQISDACKLDCFRTPGQILSLKSKFTMSIARKSTLRSSLQSPDTPLSRCRDRSMADTSLNSPLLRSGKQMSLREQVMNRSSTAQHTPPVKSLTPQLQDSLHWETSSASDNSSFQQESTRLSSFFSQGGRSRGSRRLSSLVTHDNKPNYSSINESSLNASHDSVFDNSHLVDSENLTKSLGSVFSNCSSSDCKGCQEHCCNSHLKAPSRQENITDDTPQMHRSNESVWNSYAARNLRSMRHGSYSEESDEESGNNSDISKRIPKDCSSRMFSSETGSVSDESMDHSASFASSQDLSNAFSYHSDDEMDHSINRSASASRPKTKRRQNFGSRMRKRRFDEVDASPLPASCTNNTGLTQEINLMKIYGDEHRLKRRPSELSESLASVDEWSSGCKTSITNYSSTKGEQSSVENVKSSKRSSHCTRLLLSEKLNSEPLSFSLQEMNTSNVEDVEEKKDRSLGVIGCLPQSSSPPGKPPCVPADLTPSIIVEDVMDNIPHNKDNLGSPIRDEKHDSELNLQRTPTEMLGIPKMCLEKSVESVKDDHSHLIDTPDSTDPSDQDMEDCSQSENKLSAPTMSLTIPRLMSSRSNSGVSSPETEPEQAAESENKENDQVFLDNPNDEMDCESTNSALVAGLVVPPRTSTLVSILQNANKKQKNYHVSLRCPDHDAEDHVRCVLPCTPPPALRINSEKNVFTPDLFQPLKERSGTPNLRSQVISHKCTPLSKLALSTPMGQLMHDRRFNLTPGNFLTPAQAHKTPFRTPKSIRRCKQPPEEERILGTPDYLAPEILNQQPHGTAVDWWALGVCLFEFLTGVPPFNDQTPEMVFKNILNRDIPWPEGEEALSEKAKDAVEMILTMDPNKRPAAKEIKAMPLFADLEWQSLLEKQPPFVPQPDDETDTTYFEARNTMQKLVVSGVDF